MTERNKNYIYGETFSAEAPRPSAFVYEVLSQHLSGGDLESREALNDVYKTLGRGERAVADALDSHERSGMLDRNDILILTVLLGTAKIQGPNLAFLEGLIVSGNLDPSKVASNIAVLNFDSNIIGFLLRICERLQRRNDVTNVTLIL